MKKILVFTAAVLLCTLLLAQSPENISYQAVIRDNSNQLVVSTQVGMQISILEGPLPGTIVFRETHTTTTNANGLVTIEIGGGSVLEGDFSAIDWSSDAYYVKTETDPTGGTTYTITGTSQLLSVPYSFYSDIAGQLSIGDTWLKNGSNIYYNDGKVGIGTDDPSQTLHIDGTVPFLGTGIVSDGNDRTTLLLTGGFPNLIIGSTGNDNHGATLGFWNYDNVETTTHQWNLGGGQNGYFSIGYATNSTNPHCGINGYTGDCTNALTAISITPQGNVGIGEVDPIAKLTVNSGTTIGTYSDQGWSHTSDARLKKDIESLSDVLSDVLKLQGRRFRFINDNSSTQQIGFIAQDVEKVFPEFVVTDSRGYKSLTYGQVSAVLVEAIKEQQELIESLQSQIDELNEKINKM